MTKAKAAEDRSTAARKKAEEVKKATPSDAAAIAAAHFHSRYRFRAAIEFAICSFVHGFLGSPCGVVRRRVSMYVLEARP